MIQLPERIHLANLPTRIEKLSSVSGNMDHPVVYIKRDDQTGMETSGNKIRKLEYSIREALDDRCDCLITCGGIQSNHCRATIAAGAKLGMKVCIVLQGDPVSEYDGNLFLDKLLGADIRFVPPVDYKKERTQIMDQIKKEMEGKGLRPYIVPVGASNGIGAFGYYTALQEITKQEDELGLRFDCIVVAVGSGGTYSGLFLARTILAQDRSIYGISVGDSATQCRHKIRAILNESAGYLKISLNYSADDINIIDGYVGKGYGLSSQNELQFIADFARMEGIILDPVYTGKAMYGLTMEMRKGFFDAHSNILFIHTGGIFDIFAYKKLFESYVWNKNS